MLRTWAAAPETSVSGWPSRRWKPSQPSSRTTHDRVGFLSHISHSSWHRCSTSQNHQRHLGACQKCALRPCPNYGVRICILTPQVMHIHDTRSTAMDYFVLKTMKWHWMFLQLQYFFFSVIAYSVQSIPVGNLEIILFFLSKGGSGTQLLKAFQTALHATANWWEACLHEYASRRYHY